VGALKPPGVLVDDVKRRKILEELGVPAVAPKKVVVEEFYETCLNLPSSIKMDWFLVLLFVFMIESNLEASGIEQILLRNCFKYKLLPIHCSNVTLRLRVMQSIL
jgi:hypothetical protein